MGLKPNIYTSEIQPLTMTFKIQHASDNRDQTIETRRNNQGACKLLSAAEIQQPPSYSQSSQYKALKSLHRHKTSASKLLTVILLSNS